MSRGQTYHSGVNPYTGVTRRSKRPSIQDLMAANPNDVRPTNSASIGDGGSKIDLLSDGSEGAVSTTTGLESVAHAQSPRKGTRPTSCVLQGRSVTLAVERCNHLHPGQLRLTADDRVRISAIGEPTNPRDDRKIGNDDGLESFSREIEALSLEAVTHWQRGILRKEVNIRHAKLGSHHSLHRHDSQNQLVLTATTTLSSGDSEGVISPSAVVSRLLADLNLAGDLNDDSEEKRRADAARNQAVEDYIHQRIPAPLNKLETVAQMSNCVTNTHSVLYTSSQRLQAAYRIIMYSTAMQLLYSYRQIIAKHSIKLTEQFPSVSDHGQLLLANTLMRLVLKRIELQDKLPADPFRETNPEEKCSFKKQFPTQQTTSSLSANEEKFQMPESNVIKERSERESSVETDESLMSAGMDSNPCSRTASRYDIDDILSIEDDDGEIDIQAEEHAVETASSREPVSSPDQEESSPSEIESIMSVLDEVDFGNDAALNLLNQIVFNTIEEITQITSTVLDITVMYLKKASASIVDETVSNVKQLVGFTADRLPDLPGPPASLQSDNPPPLTDGSTEAADSFMTSDNRPDPRTKAISSSKNSGSAFMSDITPRDLSCSTSKRLTLSRSSVLENIGEEEEMVSTDLYDPMMDDNLKHFETKMDPSTEGSEETVKSHSLQTSDPNVSSFEAVDNGKETKRKLQSFATSGTKSFLHGKYLTLKQNISKGKSASVFKDKDDCAVERL